MASPAVTAPKMQGDLYGASVVSHTSIVAPIAPGAQLILRGSIMVYNDPAGANGPPDHSLRIIASVDDIRTFSAF
jgi:hypothetical protein